METEKSINRLAGDVRRRPRLHPMAARLSIGIAISGIPVALILLTMFSPNTHLHDVRPTVAFTLFAALALAGASFVAALILSRPEHSFDAVLAWAPAAIILAIGVAAELAFVPRQQWFVRMVGDSPFACFASVFLLSLPVLFGALWALRPGAPANPSRAGALGGLLAGGITSALYLLHCPENSLLFTAAWHVPAIVLISASGAMLGQRMLHS